MDRTREAPALLNSQTQKIMSSVGRSVTLRAIGENLSTPATAQAGPSHQAIAPAWHTVIILVVLLGFSLLSYNRGNLPGVGGYGRVRGYALTMVMEWALTVFMWYGIRRRGVRMRDLVGGRWNSITDFLRDFGIAFSFLIVCGLGVNGLVTFLLGAKTPPSVRNLLPQTPTEIAVFLMLAMTAGFCEEAIFRGYLQRQFAALTRSMSGGILLQGIVFGAAHGYQGWKLMVSIAIFGITFGLMAIWRRSLRPGMIAHFLQDGIGGILGSHLMH